MSFASDCKIEIMNKEYDDKEIEYLLLGMIITGATFSSTEVKFTTTQEDIKDYFKYQMLNRYKEEARVSEENVQSSSFLHNYVLTYPINNNTKKLFDIDLDKVKVEIKDDESNKNAYLAGAFLARGSVNDPNTCKYHFEISLQSSENATYLLRIVNQYDFNAKIIKRRNRYIVYLKDAEKIVDILRLIGATNNAFHFEDIRIERDLSNSINRVINCEVANEQKALLAAREQLKAFNYLESVYPLEKLDNKLLMIMKVRKDNPDATLIEMLDILEKDYGEIITKSGLSHRIRKLKELANDEYIRRNFNNNL